MATRTRKQGHEEGDQEAVSLAEMAMEPQQPDALREDLKVGFQGLHSHMDKISAQIESLNEDIQGPHWKRADSAEQSKVLRRRSLDDMQFALKRLTSGEPRPADDDSPQVIQDAINETIALRQIVSDMMQASYNVYQHGLVAIREMTSR